VDTFELIEVLTASQTRIDLLDELLDGPGSKRELAEKHDIAGSTVYRNLQTLADRGWIEQDSDGTYRLSPLGERIAREVDAFRRGIEQTAANRAFLREYRGHLDIPNEVLAAVTTSTATPSNAQQATRNYLNTVGSTLAQGADVRMFGGTIGPLIADVVNQLIKATDSLEIIIDETTAEADEYGFYERAQRGDADGEFTMLIHPERLRSGLIIFDDQLAMVGAYDERGDIQAGFHGGGDVVIDWAEAAYESVRQRSRRVG
jgi:predicted transcriptional regulator